MTKTYFTVSIFLPTELKLMTNLQAKIKGKIFRKETFISYAKMQINMLNGEIQKAEEEIFWEKFIYFCQTGKSFD